MVWPLCQLFLRLSPWHNHFALLLLEAIVCPSRGEKLLPGSCCWVEVGQSLLCFVWTEGNPSFCWCQSFSCGTPSLARMGKGSWVLRSLSGMAKHPSAAARQDMPGDSTWASSCPWLILARRCQLRLCLLGAYCCPAGALPPQIPPQPAKALPSQC